MDWLTQAFERDSSLERSPLMVVTLALIAARSQAPEQLPRGRAEILKRSLFDAVQHWDIEQRARGQPILGSLAGTQAREGITTALTELCRTAVDVPGTTEAHLRRDLAHLFSTQFALAPAQARSSAHDALQFWLDTGLFSLQDGSLLARTPPLAEVGTAASLELASDDDLDRWIFSTRNDPVRWEALALAAGLSPAVAKRWIERFAQDGSTSELIEIVDAISDGVVVDDHDVDVIVVRGRQLLDNGTDVERTAEALITLPLTDTQRNALRSRLLEAVPAERKLVIEALMVTTWREAGPHADAVLRALIAEVEPDPDELTRGEDGIIHIESSYVDGPYRDVYEGAARRLVENGRADAELVVEHKFAGSMAHHHAVLRALEHAGHSASPLSSKPDGPGT
jgi:hypothetical protein